MRVVGGRWRGLRLPAHLPKGVRPTSDRVREAVFDILGSLDVVPGSRVVDLFCGSGALGLEALSRGASTADFVDRDQTALEAVRTNAGHLRAEESIRVVRATLPSWLERGGPGASEGPGGPRRGADRWIWDLAFCDPPYAFAAWPRLLGALPAAVAVLESAGEVELPPAWDRVRSRRYGGTLVTVARRRDLPAHDLSRAEVPAEERPAAGVPEDRDGVPGHRDGR